MKTVYLVRHGSTLANESAIFQTADTPLSEKGRVQAQFLAQRFKNISFDALISSKMLRAHETATAISQVTGHPVILEDSLHEALRPSSLRGKSMHDSEAKVLIETTRVLWDNPHKKHSDEENFFDVRDRAITALTRISERPEDRIVVVTHGTFMKVMLSIMMMGATVEPKYFEYINDFFYPKNTGITCCELDSRAQERWKLITWSDHAHLG